MSRSVELTSVSLPSSWRAHLHKVSSIAVGTFMWVIIRNVHLSCPTCDFGHSGTNIVVSLVP